MKTFRTIILISAFILAACTRSPVELRFVMPISPIDQEIVADMVKLLGRESAVELKLTSRPLSGSAALDALLAGTADIALVSNHLPFRKGIATVMPLYPTVLHIAYRKDSIDVGEEIEIRGARVFAGRPGSASRLMFERIIARTGIGEEDFSYVNIDTELPDIVIVFAPISPDRLEQLPDFRLWSLGAPAEIGQGTKVDAAVLLNPTLRPFVIPLGTYGDATPEPILTVAVDQMLVAREGLDQSAIYDLINELRRLRPALAAQHPGLFQEFSEDFDTGRSTFVLHPGTLDYLHRSEPSVYERYSGIAEVAVTVLIALISMIFAGVRVFRMRRKNRIDEFYSETIRLRNSVSHESSLEERTAVRDQVRSLQNTAFDMLVHEKLAADESFRIFITLSNDVLRQLAN